MIGNQKPDVQQNELYEEAVKRFASSELFFKIFDETINLVQSASDYLEGQGRIDQSELPDKPALRFASESVKMTNNLMQISGWLLAHRSFYKGEAKVAKVGGLEGISHEETEGLDKTLSVLPVRLVTLLTRSQALYQRILRLDEQLRNASFSRVNLTGESVSDQLRRLQENFTDLIAQRKNDEIETPVLRLSE